MSWLQNEYIFKGLESLFFVILIYFIALQIIKLINRSSLDLKVKHKSRKLTLYISSFTSLLILGLIWVKNIRAISLFLSVVGAGLVVALGDTILSIAGWFLILFRKPFDVGDRIEIDGIAGDVIDIRLFQTTLLEIKNWIQADQSTGRILHFPNSLVFKKPLFNYTREFEFIWNEIKLTITFESNWEKARELMLSFAYEEAKRIEQEVASKIKKMSEKYLIYYHKLTPIVYIRIVDNGIELSLRYLTSAKLRRISEDKLSQDILNEFAKHSDINFAYPTYRIVR